MLWLEWIWMCQRYANVCVQKRHNIQTQCKHKQVSASVCLNGRVQKGGSVREEKLKQGKRNGRKKAWSQTHVARARWKNEQRHLESNSVGYWDKYQLVGRRHTRKPCKCFFFFSAVHRSSQELTSTISLTSNSPVYSGYSCYTHLIIVLDLVPLVLLPFESASFTHTGSGQDSIQSNINPAAGHEMPEVSACYSGNMRIRTSWYKN